MRFRSSGALLLGALLALPLLAGCDNAAPDADAAALSGDAASEAALRQQLQELQRTNPQLAQDIAAVRRATAPFQRFEVAQAAGWYDPDAECVEVPGLGGMGYHHVNWGLAGNADLEVTAPEVLLYEPQRNGRLKLVAVEYIVPFDFHGPDEDPPVIMGMELHPNPFLGLWALHAWVWEHNPDGMFEDWNSRISCQYAD